MGEEPITKKMGFGRVQCPHCGTVRQGRDAIDEHIEVAHSNVKRVGGAVETLGGADFAPDALVKFADEIAAQHQPEQGDWREGMDTGGVDPDVATKVRSFAGSLPQMRGKRMPEFIIMWRPDCVAVKVHSARWIDLLLGKNYRLRPPSQAEYDEFWFHWRCPIPTCKDSKAMCRMHNAGGSDSNHPLKSPEYMVIQHLQSGGKLHRQYFEMHKEELQTKYRAAFAAFELQMNEAQKKSAEIKAEAGQRQQEALAGAKT